MPVERVTCKVCDGGILRRTTVRRFPGTDVGFVGHAWAILGMLLAASAVLTVAAMLLTINESPDAESAALSFAFGITVMIPFLCSVGLLALVSFTVGAFLLNRRRVLKCSSCGAVIDSA